jgi:hypothetical protein
MSDRQGVEIDYCPECRGVWLDRGELDKIIDRSSAPPTQQRYEKGESKQHAHGSRDYEDRKKKKRKNLLGELFDF